MNQEEILSGNKLVAEFMGAKKYHTGFIDENIVLIFPMFDNPAQSINKKTTHNLKDLKYHSSWSWQIPVWKELYTKFTNKIGDEKLLKEFLVFYEQLLRCIKLYDVLQAFKSLIEAIKYYNQHV